MNPLDVEYVDAEFTELDARREVQSPTDKSSRSKGFLSLVSNRNKNEQPPVQDPTFKDFTYFCDDPDALVEVTNLVHELHPSVDETTTTKPPMVDCFLDESSIDVPMPDPNGTPLISFVENGKLNAVTISRSPHRRKTLEEVEATMNARFNQVEKEIAQVRLDSSADAVETTPPPVPVTNGQLAPRHDSSSSSSANSYDASLVV